WAFVSSVAQAISNLSRRLCSSGSITPASSSRSLALTPARGGGSGIGWSTSSNLRPAGVIAVLTALRMWGAVNWYIATVRLFFVAPRKVSSSDQPASGLTQIVSVISSSTRGRLGGSSGSYVPVFGGAKATTSSPAIRFSKAEAVGPPVAKWTGSSAAGRANCSSTVASTTEAGTPYFAVSSASLTGRDPGATATTSAGTGGRPAAYL